MRSTELGEVAWTSTHKQQTRMSPVENRSCSKLDDEKSRGRLGADRVVVGLGADDDARDDPGDRERAKEVKNDRRSLGLICGRTRGPQSISDVNCGAVRLGGRHAC